jgi:hypothetical protein
MTALEASALSSSGGAEVSGTLKSKGKSSIGRAYSV